MDETAKPHRRWYRTARSPIRRGLVGVGLWLVFLCWAFVLEPAMDNLAVGWVVWALLGLPGIEAMSKSPAIFTLVLLGETSVLFITFVGVTAVFQKIAGMKFSVRTFLAITTLVAFWTGLAVYATRPTLWISCAFIAVLSVWLAAGFVIDLFAWALESRSATARKRP